MFVVQIDGDVIGREDWVVVVIVVETQSGADLVKSETRIKGGELNNVLRILGVVSADAVGIDVDVVALEGVGEGRRGETVGIEFVFYVELESFTQTYASADFHGYMPNEG